MRAWKVAKPGLDNTFLTENVPVPELTGDYDILIKVLAVGLNPIDYKIADSFDEDVPSTLGLDACGLVARVGNKVNKEEFLPGKTVVLMLGDIESKHGYFAEYTIHDSRHLSIVPESIYQEKDLVDIACNLAALPFPAFTAYQIICNKLKLPLFDHHKNSSSAKIVRNIFVNDGFVGVGAFCLQLLKLWRDHLPNEEKELVKIITTCPPEDEGFVKSLGATEVIACGEAEIVKKCQDLTENFGVDIFIDTVGGGKNVKIAMETLSFGGELVLSTGGVGKNLDLKSLWKKSQSLHYVLALHHYIVTEDEKLEELTKIGDRILKLYQKGLLDPLVTEKICFEDIQISLKELQNEKKHVKGKIVARATESKYKIY